MPVLIAIFAVGAYGFGYALRGSRRHRQRGRDRPRRARRDRRHRPRSISASSRRPGARTSCHCPVARCCRRRSSVTSSPVRAPCSTSSRATPPRSATCRSDSGRSGRCGPRPRSRCPKIHADLRLVNGVVEGTIRNDSDKVLESPAVVLGGNVVVLADIPPGGRGAGQAPAHGQPVRPGAVGQDLRSDLLQRERREQREAASSLRPATGSSIS